MFEWVEWLFHDWVLMIACVAAVIALGWLVTKFLQFAFQVALRAVVGALLLVLLVGLILFASEMRFRGPPQSVEVPSAVWKL